MTNFQILFTCAWLMLLIIPSLFFTLFPYFRINRRYRRSRNRIVSMILHGVIMFLCICVLSGMTFSYDIPNTNNEIMLVVDVSYSSEKNADKRDQFVEDVIAQSNNMFKVGVVTFGYDHVYAAELTNDCDQAYKDYLESFETNMPDTTATDISSALLFAADQFENPTTAKIVLVSDGVETDGKVRNIIKSVSSRGIKVDTRYVDEMETNTEVEILDILVPEQSIKLNEQYELGVVLKSSYEGPATITFHDVSYDADGNMTEKDTDPMEVTLTVSTIEGLAHNFTYIFESRGVHELSFSITSDDGKDTLVENNVFTTYVYLEEFNNILLITEENKADYSLEELLTSQEVMGVEYNVTSLEMGSPELPTNLKELREYDQVILSGVTNNSLSAMGFDVLLEQYVGQIGGSLLTIGSDNAYAYGQMFYYDNEQDVTRSTTYQKMLPVQAVHNYEPPMAVVFVIDRSGSMSSSFNGEKKVVLAKNAAIDAVQNTMRLESYAGVMSLETSYTTELRITSCTKKAEIIQAIQDIPDSGGGTVFTGAIQRAGNALMALSDVERKHIVLITDGEPSDKLDDGAGGGYGEYIKHFYQNGITLSVLGIGMSESATTKMEDACALAGGPDAGSNVINVTDPNRDSVTASLENDLRVDPIAGEYAASNVSLKIDPANTYYRMLSHNDITSDLIPQIHGYYGTKLKPGSKAIVTGASCPIYAEHAYGKGMVGSIMTSLEYANDFLNSNAGYLFLQFAVNELFPTQNIRSHDIEMYVTEENYTTKVAVDTTLTEDQSMVVKIIPPVGNAIELTRDATNYSRFSFTVTDEDFKNRSGNYAGLYTIITTKYDESGKVISTSTAYSTFSYSAEYDSFVDTSDRADFMAMLAENGNGAVIERSDDVFNDFDIIIHQEYDPRLLFTIISVVLFLLDVAVRKFKFKWIHEIVRDSKERKAVMQRTARNRV